MKWLAVIGLALIVLALVPPVTARETNPILTLSVYQNGRTIGSTVAPERFTAMAVETDGGDASLEVVSQVEPEPGERLIVISQLDRLIVTALTSRGVVGEPKAGGYDIPTTNGEVAVIRLSGVMPKLTKRAAVIQIVSETDDSFRTLVTVTATVKPPPGWLSALGRIMKPWGAIVMAGGIIALLLWLLLRRRRLRVDEG